MAHDVSMTPLKKATYILQAGLLLLVALLFKALPMDAASSLGGMLARMIGPLLRAHRIADANLQRVFPDYGDHQRAQILARMWENLGRVAGEYGHLSPEAMRRRMTIEGAEYLTHARDTRTPTLFVGGHFANWEMCPIVGVVYNLPAIYIYREANNPYAEMVIRWLRGGYRDLLFGKGRESAAQMIRTLKDKGSIGILMDQKFNEGEPISLFGHPAMTVTSPAKLAIKFKAQFMPLRVVRTDGAHFHITVGPPIPYTDDTTAADLMEAMHRIYEQWIKEKPEQWFWVHNRWNWKEKRKIVA